MRFQIEFVMEVNEDRVQQTLKCSFQTCQFGTAVQFVMQYYHTKPGSETDSGRQRGDRGARCPRAFGETNTALGTGPVGTQRHLGP